MFDKATSGILENNDRFSSCSKDSIKKNIDRKRSQRPDCFTSADQSICGNKIVEKGEQCDCGDKTTCQEDCCIAAGEANECTLPVRYQCSPSQGMYHAVTVFILEHSFAPFAHFYNYTDAQKQLLFFCVSVAFFFWSNDFCKILKMKTKFHRKEPGMI